MYRKIEPQINKAKVSYSQEIFVCKLKVKCISPDSSIVLFFINEIVHSLNPFNCLLCAGTVLGTRKQQKAKKQSPVLRMLTIHHVNQTSKLIMSITVVLLCARTHTHTQTHRGKKYASAVIGTNSGSYVTTWEEPVVQLQGIRKAILKEDLENERLKS